MINRLFLVVALLSLCFYLYGVLVTVTNVEENACQMTYMYEYPQFVRVNFKKNKEFPKYNVYAYSEGHLTEKARAMEFTGAPVIFVPGNSGSYKQVRSLASVALRKGVDNNWATHLDYFTIDFNEEYSALFGGFLADQTAYLKHSILAILDLYRKLPNRPQSVVIVAHSMGGKIVQAAMTDRNISDVVNTIIAIASPLDKPVLNLDAYFDNFYTDTNNYWLQHRQIKHAVTNSTNFCRKQFNYNIRSNAVVDDKKVVSESGAALQDDPVEMKSIYHLNDKLLITIGGGSRDILVHAGLTTSKFSDIHIMSTAMSNVWLTTDHLCAVWCLQQVLVINRFLYSIIEAPKGRDNTGRGQGFIDDKRFRYQMAKRFFLNNGPARRTEGTNLDVDQDLGDWVEDSRRVFNLPFRYGLNKTRTQMIRLSDLPVYEMLNVEAINVETDDWVFGCAAVEVSGNMRYCPKATSITHLTTKLPSRRHDRTLLSLNLHKIKKIHSDWTHVLLRLSPSKEPLQLNIDIHAGGDRQLLMKMPKWYSFSEIKLVNDTILGSTFYTLQIDGMEEAHQSLELSVQAGACSKSTYHSVAKLCVPWTKGFDRYHFFTEMQSSPMYINVPQAKPSGYNTSVNAITVDLHLDPSCRYTITVRNSLGSTMARLVQQYSHWLPAHLVTILLLAFKYQISLSPSGEPFKSGKLHSALIKCSPFFIITASRVFIKIILWAQSLPKPDPIENSMFVSIVVHGAAMAILSLGIAAIWIAVSFCGNVAYKFLFKLIQFPIPQVASFLIPVIEKFPIAVGVLLISIAFASCGGLALICAVGVYFVLITKMYEEYLEEFVHKTARQIAKKLFGSFAKRRNSDHLDENEPSADENLLNNEADATKEESTNEDETAVESVETKDDEIQKKSTPDDDKDDEAESNENDEDEDDEEDGKQVRDLSEEEQLADEELDKLLQETMQQQKESEDTRKKQQMTQRMEYDAIHQGLSAINFHITLFILLIIITLLNVPTVISWAKNFGYSPVLKSDPSFSASIITLVSLCIIWQLRTPRDVMGYKTIACMFYAIAVVSVLYCQDSVFRLSAVISTIFFVVAAHQVFAPKNKLSLVDEVSPEEADLLEKVQRIRASLLNEN